jgi:hypothetical protein
MNSRLKYIQKRNKMRQKPRAGSTYAQDTVQQASFNFQFSHSRAFRFGYVELLLWYYVCNWSVYEMLERTPPTTSTKPTPKLVLVVGIKLS